jgi:uncharacterized OB-fold protein
MRTGYVNDPDADETAPKVGADQYFRDQLRAGRFVIQRSRSTGEYVFYPRVIAPGTGTADLEWMEASGLGSVYSTTIVLKSDAEASYNIAIIELAEGPRMLSRVIGLPPNDVQIGMAVRAEIGYLGDEAVILFRPVSGSEPTAAYG